MQQVTLSEQVWRERVEVTRAGEWPIAVRQVSGPWGASLSYSYLHHLPCDLSWGLSVSGCQLLLSQVREIQEPKAWLYNRPQDLVTCLDPAGVG